VHFSNEQALARGKMIQECLHVMWVNRYTPSPEYISGYLEAFHPAAVEETTSTTTVRTSSSTQTQKTMFYFLSDVSGDTSTSTSAGAGSTAQSNPGTTTTTSSQSMSNSGTSTKVQSVDSSAMLATTIDAANRKRRADIIAYLTNLRVIVAKNQTSQNVSASYLNQWNDFAKTINKDLSSDLAISSFTVTTLNRPMRQQPLISDLADVIELGNPSDSFLFRMTSENRMSICIDTAGYSFVVNESRTYNEIVDALKSGKYKYVSMHVDYTDSGISYDDGVYRIQYNTGAKIVLSARFSPTFERSSSRRYYGYTPTAQLVSVRNGNINPPPVIVHCFNCDLFTYAHCELLTRLTGHMPLSAYVDTSVSTYVTIKTTQLLQNGASIYRQRITSIIAMRMLLDPTCLVFPLVTNMNGLNDDDLRLLSDNLQYWTGWMWSYHYKRQQTPPTVFVRLVEAFSCSRACSPDALVQIPEIIRASWWFNYAIVHSNERQRMGLEKRVCVCEWMQRADEVCIKQDMPITTLNLFFKNAVRALFFCARNETIHSERSHYDARSMLVSWDGIGLPAPALPIVQTLSLFYGKVGKFEKMPLDHFSLVEPYLHAKSSGIATGLAMLSFANDIRIAPPNGHVNFSNLQQISTQFEETSDVTLLKTNWELLQPNSTTPPEVYAHVASDRRLVFNPNWRYACCVYALTNNIIEISRGTIKFLF
jgi:hypothetical protein